jgi:hypothetical protein
VAVPLLPAAVLPPPALVPPALVPPALVPPALVPALPDVPGEPALVPLPAVPGAPAEGVEVGLSCEHPTTVVAPTKKIPAAILKLVLIILRNLTKSKWVMHRNRWLAR